MRVLRPGLASCQLAVELVRADAGEGGDDAGRRARPGAGGNEAAERVDREGEVGAGLGPLCRRDDDDDLAAGLVAEATGELAERAAGDLLVDLRQLAADGRWAIGGERGERGERIGQAPGRLE